MAKISKLFTLDPDVGEALEKETNASKLVNDILTEHFFGTSSNKETEIRHSLKEIDRDLIKKEDMKTELLGTLSNLLEQRKSQEKKLKGIPDKILEDFRSFPDMTEEILKNRYITLYQKQISWEDMKKAYRDFKDET